MKQSIPLILLLAFFLPGCMDQQKDTLQGTWRIYQVEPMQKNGSGKKDFDSQVRFTDFINEGKLLNFFEDGAYSELQGEDKYHQGKWAFTPDKQLKISTPDGRSQLFRFELERGADEKPRLTLYDTKADYTIRFLKDYPPLKTFSDDPFYPSNNTWRIRPVKKEGAPELRTRLNGYVKHLALVLKAATERKQSVVSFRHSMGPVKIYDGGIGIYPYSMVPASWKNNYYDSIDASTSYNIFSNYLEHSDDYQGAATGKWIEDDYDILLSIYADLAKVKQE